MHWAFTNSAAHQCHDYLEAYRPNTPKSATLFQLCSDARTYKTFSNLRVCDLPRQRSKCKLCRLEGMLAIWKYLDICWCAVAAQHCTRSSEWRQTRLVRLAEQIIECTRSGLLTNDGQVEVHFTYRTDFFSPVIYIFLNCFNYAHLINDVVLLCVFII